MKIQSVQDLETISRQYRQRIYHPDSGVKVNIGMASCGIAAGAQAAFDKAVEAFADNPAIQICQTGCIGYCELEPALHAGNGFWASCATRAACLKMTATTP